MSPAQTNSQRQQTLTQRRAEQGITRVHGLWAHKSLHQRIKDHAAQLERERQEQEKQK